MDFTGGTSWTSVDPYGHGTHIAGTIGGGTSEVPGIAKEVKLISLRVLNENGEGTTSNVIRAIQWAIDNRVVEVDRHHQSVAGPSHLRAGRHRSAGAGG